MSNDLIADCLTRIRNSQRACHKSVRVRGSTMVKNFLTVLRAEGFIEAFEIGEKAPLTYEVFLKYFPTGEPVVRVAKRVSRSGCRVYSPCEKIEKIACGLGLAVISTSKGVLSDKEARRQKVGGEILAYIAP